MLQSLHFRDSRQRRGGHCYSLAGQSTVALRKQSAKTFRGKHIVHSARQLSQTAPLHQDLKLAFTSFCISAKKESNLIRDRQLKQSTIREIISSRKILSHYLTLSFFGFGLFRETNSAHAVMASSRLHFTLDKTALTCCIQSLKDMHTAFSCNRKLMHSVPRQGLQSAVAQSIGAQCVRVQWSARMHSKERNARGRAGGACNEHSGRAK